jgi:hypothetical protein
VPLGSSEFRPDASIAEINEILENTRYVLLIFGLCSNSCFNNPSRKSLLESNMEKETIAKRLDDVSRERENYAANQREIELKYREQASSLTREISDLRGELSAADSKIRGLER